MNNLQTKPADPESLRATLAACANCDAFGREEASPVEPKVDSAQAAVQPALLYDPNAPVEASQRMQNGYRDSGATFIFQTLGYVKLKSGEVQAIVADGLDTYLVKKGEIFAEDYKATSVDPFIVLAVKAPPIKPLPDFLAGQTDLEPKFASNSLHNLTHTESTDRLGLLTLGDSGQNLRSAHSPEQGIHLFNTLPTGMNVQSYFSPIDHSGEGH